MCSHKRDYREFSNFINIMRCNNKKQKHYTNDTTFNNNKLISKLIHFPNAIWQFVFQYLSVAEMPNIMRLNKYFNNLSWNIMSFRSGSTVQFDSFKTLLYNKNPQTLNLNNIAESIHPINYESFIDEIFAPTSNHNVKSVISRECIAYIGECLAGDKHRENFSNSLEQLVIESDDVDDLCHSSCNTFFSFVFSRSRLKNFSVCCCNKLHSDFVIILDDYIKINKNLETLNLKRTGFGSGVTQLTSLGSIKKLILSANPELKNYLPQLVRLLRTSYVTELDLSDISLTGRVPQILQLVRSNPRLQILHLRNCGFSNKELLRIMSGVSNNSALITLDLQMNDISDKENNEMSETQSLVTNQDKQSCPTSCCSLNMADIGNNQNDNEG